MLLVSSLITNKLLHLSQVSKPQIRLNLIKVSIITFIEDCKAMLNTAITRFSIVTSHTIMTTQIPKHVLSRQLFMIKLFPISMIKKIQFLMVERVPRMIEGNSHSLLYDVINLPDMQYKKQSFYHKKNCLTITCFGLWVVFKSFYIQ